MAEATVDTVVAQIAYEALIGAAALLIALVALNCLGACLTGVLPHVDRFASVVTPGCLRRCTLGLCGIAITTSAASATAFARPHVPPVPTLSPDRVSGLALPDLPTAPAQTVLLVHRGDCLWSIARRTLPGSATDAAVASRVASLYAANRRTVGPDPDLIFPGQPLLIPGGV